VTRPLRRVLALRRREALLITLGAWLLETWHFGWNAEPCCWQEAACDGLSYLMLMMAVL
jgi:hypothetical protein